MKKLIIVAALMTAFCSMASAQAVKDWARTDRFASANAETTKKPVAVFMGDSITEGWFGQDEAFFTEHNYAGRGISGQTTCQMLVRFRPDVIDLHPKYVVILAGTNDVAQNLGPVDLRTSLANIISMCELAKVNRIKPIICSVPPCGQFSWRKELEPANTIVAFNKMLKAYAESENIPYVDYHKAMKDENNAMIADYTKDGCHPTIDGYKKMESIIVDYLK